MGLSVQSLMTGIVRSLLPVKTVDSALLDIPARVNGYGEQVIRETPNNYYGLCDEGSLLLATNPTVSTGEAWVAAQTAFSDTAPNFYIGNNEPVGGKSIRLHYLKMITTTAATAATAIHYAAVLDTVARLPTTDHTQVITPVCPNGNLSNTLANLTMPTVLVQTSTTATVIPASSANKRLVARGVLGGLNIAGDELQINFGEPAAAVAATTAAEGAGQPGRRISQSPPICIPPGGCLVIHIWMPSSSASIVPEFELLMSAR